MSSEGVRPPYCIREIRVPVPTPLHIAQRDVPTFAMPEYFVVEQWSDYTMRHPTSGVRVSMELWAAKPTEALRILRTEGR